MKLIGIATQQTRHALYRADGTIATGGTAQLVLAKSQARSHLIIYNISAGTLFVEIGAGRATCTISGGAVNSITVTNAGFGFTRAPIIRFYGGGLPPGNSSYLGLNQPNGASPSNTAVAHAVLSGGAISSIVIDNAGSGYVIAPYVDILSDDLDPYGASLPSASSGIVLSAGASLNYNGTVCPTEPVAIWGATTGQAYTCGWMD